MLYANKIFFLVNIIIRFQRMIINIFVNYISMRLFPTSFFTKVLINVVMSCLTLIVINPVVEISKTLN